ncbi:MAG: hypothetical protein H6838_17905 [Planctomycetes bacterium]|nr:hypothetical protein [Planctomycetota bacterium]MCB9887370.1 hypothetical protein [Planctomycetota bacterium]
MRGPTCFLLALSLSACGDTPTGATAGAGTPSAASSQVPQPQALSHDFGTIPHGEARQYDYVFDLASIAAPGRRYVPLRAHIDCSCGRTQVLIRNPEGYERVVDGRPDPTNAPEPGDTLLVRLFLDTKTKDAVDLKSAASRGYLLLQPVGDRDGSQRVTWPFLVQFAIDAPVVLRPFAELDFGRVPQSATPTITTTLRGDENHPDIEFGAVTCTSPDITATLEPEQDDFVLRARCRPGQLGNQAAVLQIATNLPGGYSVNLGVKWKVVPDLEAAPLPKLSFRADLGRAQTEAEAATQFLLVVDHDESRPPQFEVRQLVDDAGRDGSAWFAATLVTVPGSSRQQRLFVRSLGGHPADFRGRIVLGKPGAADGPTLSIELVAFHRP